MAQNIVLFNAQNLQSVSFTGPGQVNGVADAEAFAMVTAGYAVLAGSPED